MFVDTVSQLQYLSSHSIRVFPKSCSFFGLLALSSCTAHSRLPHMIVGCLQSRYCTDTPHISRTDKVLHSDLQVAELAGVVLVGDKSYARRQNRIYLGIRCSLVSYEVEKFLDTLMTLHVSVLSYLY
jgi:hypothetical protein